MIAAINRPVNAVVEDTADAVEGRGFHLQARQIEHSVASGSPPL